MITYCSTSAVRTMKLCSISNELFTTEYCLRQPNYVLVSSHIKTSMFAARAPEDV